MSKSGVPFVSGNPPALALDEVGRALWDALRRDAGTRITARDAAGLLRYSSHPDDLPEAEGVEPPPESVCAILSVSGRTFVRLSFLASCSGVPSPLEVRVLIPAAKPAHAAGDPRTSRMLARIPDLTPRERDVLALIGQGKRSKQIALHFNRSVRTVHGHTAAISRKLGSATRAEMVRLALLSGLVPQLPPTI